MASVVFINRRVKSRYFNFETDKWSSKLVEGCLINDAPGDIDSAHEIICSVRSDTCIHSYVKPCGWDSKDEDDFVAPVSLQNGRFVADVDNARKVV